jgi:hypothetical protein
VRYERRFDWNQPDAAGDSISGVANGYATVTPGLQFHAGGLATRERYNSSGASVPGAQFDDEVVQVYSLYAGPVVKTQAGSVAIDASYRIGYSRVEQEQPGVSIPGIPVQDIFEDSTVHAAAVSAAIKPGEVLPVGVGGRNLLPRGHHQSRPADRGRAGARHRDHPGRAGCRAERRDRLREGADFQPRCGA